MPNRIIITRKRKLARGDHATKRKGVVRPRRDGRDPGRRRLKKTGGIRFFDLGDLITGTDPYASFIPPVIGTPTLPGDCDSAYFSLRDQVLAISASEIFSSFRKMTKTAAVSRDLLIGYTDDSLGYIEGRPSTIDKFVDDSLNLSDTELSTLSVYGRIPFLDSVLPSGDDGGTWKITNTASFAASSVSFTRSANMDVGWMPALTYQLGAVTTSSSDGQYLNGIAAVVPRSAAPALYLDDAPSAWALAYDRYRWMRLSPDARANSTLTGSIPPSSFAPSGDFPAPPSTPNPMTTLWDSVVVGAGGSVLPSGALMFIIKKENQIYYFWKT